MVGRDVEMGGVLNNQFSEPHRPTDDELRLVDLLAWTAADFVGRHRAEAALRESEERQAFLLELSDALRPLADPAQTTALACRLLGEHLGVDRVMYGEIDPSGETITVGRSWGRAGVASMAGRFRIGDFGRFFSDPLREGRAVYAEDAMNDPKITPEEYAHCWARVGVRSAIAYPIVKGERFVAALVIQEGRPRPWTDTEMKLVSEVAERTWEAAQRARAEAALAESEDQYRTLFASIDEGFCTIEVLFDDSGEAVDYRFLETNPAFERQTGIENGVGRTVRELAPEHEAFWFEIYGRIARTGEPRRFEHGAAALDTPRYYDVYAFRIGEPEENRVAVIFNDVLARKQAEEERERLRALASSARAEDAERRRIGRELHDRVAHTMAVAHQSLQLHRALADRDPARASEKLELARECTRTALDQTRDLSAQLARPETEETRDGLSAALRALLDAHVPDGVEAGLSVAGDESAVPQPVKEQVYLVMREAVRNAVAHSGCGRIDVSLEIDHEELKGNVRNDGSGFDPQEYPDQGRDDRGDDGYVAGMGLRSMRERTGQLGGRLEVHSEPGMGTAVEVRVPLAE